MHVKGCYILRTDRATIPICNPKHGEPLTWVDRPKKGAVMSQELHPMPSTKLKDSHVVTKYFGLIDTLRSIRGDVGLYLIPLLIHPIIVSDR